MAPARQIACWNQASWSLKVLALAEERPNRHARAGHGKHSNCTATPPTLNLTVAPHNSKLFGLASTRQRSTPRSLTCA